MACDRCGAKSRSLCGKRCPRLAGTKHSSSPEPPRPSRKGKQKTTVSVPHEFYPPFNEEQYAFLIGSGYTPDTILAANQPSSPDAKYQRALMDQALGVATDAYKTANGESYLMSPSEGWGHNYGERHGESSTSYPSADRYSTASDRSLLTLSMIESIKSNKSLRILQEMMDRDIAITTEYTAMLKAMVKRDKKAGKSFEKKWGEPQNNAYIDYKNRGYLAEVAREDFRRAQKELYSNNDISYSNVENCAKKGLMAAAKTMDLARSRYNFLYHYREAYADHDSNDTHVQQIDQDISCVKGVFKNVREILQDFNETVWKSAGLPNDPYIFAEIETAISTESELSTINFNLFDAGYD